MPETAEDQREATEDEHEDHNDERETADVDGDWMNLGPCHYDPEREATVIATREDGTGWIAVCDEHKGQAQENGFEPAE